MKFSIGDAVLLKRTGEEGTIVSFLSKTMLEVEVKGVHFPVYEEDVDHPYLKWFTEKKTAQKKKPSNVEVVPEKIKERKSRLAQGIYLSFMPVFLPDSFEDIVTHFRVFLLNETASALYFIYEVRDAAGRQVFHHQASLHPFGNLYLHPQSLEEMNEQPRFHWTISDQIAAIQSSENKGIVRIKPAKLFEHINHLLEANEPSFNYLLTDDILATVKAKRPLSMPVWQGEAIKIPQVDTDWQPKEVLDLHIEALVDNAFDLATNEILQIQCKVLEYHLDMAIAHNQQRMIIIHGVGTGKLREQVQTTLRTKKGVASFDNGWLGQYGFGATVVTFVP